MASAFIRMQELITVSAASAQPPEQAIDVGSYGVLTVQARKAQVPASGGPVTLTLEHSMSRTDESFEPTGVTFSFTTNSTGSETQVVTNPSRYLRWRASGASGFPIKFLLDVLGRER